MAGRSVTVAGSCLCLIFLASVAQATLFSYNSTLGLQKNCCHNIWSRIVAAFRNLFGFQQPASTATTPAPALATSTPSNKSSTPSTPKRGGVDELINRYSDYSWTFNFLGTNDDFSEYEGKEDNRGQPALPLCNCDCGLANQGTAGNVGKVVGGTATQKNEYPWLVRINYRDEFHCGASLIN